MTIKTMLVSDEVFAPVADLLKLQTDNVSKLTISLKVGKNVQVTIVQNNEPNRTGPFIEQRTLDIHSHDIYKALCETLYISDVPYIDLEITLESNEAVLVQYTRYITK